MYTKKCSPGCWLQVILDIIPFLGKYISSGTSLALGLRFIDWFGAPGKHTYKKKVDVMFFFVTFLYY